MLTVDVRCGNHNCVSKPIYRMVGGCLNCGATDILLLITSGHEHPYRARCPHCGNDQVHANRLATDDEIPAA